MRSTFDRIMSDPEQKRLFDEEYKELLKQEKAVKTRIIIRWYGLNWNWLLHKEPNCFWMESLDLQDVHTQFEDFNDMFDQVSDCLCSYFDIVEHSCGNVFKDAGMSFPELRMEIAECKAAIVDLESKKEKLEETLVKAEKYEALKEMVTISEEMGLYDMEPPESK